MDGAPLRSAAGDGEALARTLCAFRDAATAASRAAGLEAAAPLAAACDLVDAILLGVRSHLPGEVVDVELGAGGASDLASLAVRFAGGPLIGEFATRSRQPVELHLQRAVSFAIRRPATDDFKSEPLVLAVSGIELHVLPEIDALRRRLREDLESYPDGWHPRSAGAWWKSKRETEFPIESSKLRRLCDSFTEVASLPQYFQGMAFWGYLHITSRIFDSFDFYMEGQEVSATAQTRLLHPEEEALVDVGRGLCSDLLSTHRSLAEHFAASTVNMGALFEGRAFGQKGANPAKIAKLFSAASRWGPGDDGWHQLDDTWLCVDTKDRWGRVFEEQGRILWHAPGAPRVGDGRTAAKQPQSRRALATQGSKQSAASRGCPAIAVVAIGVVLMLPAVAHAAAGFGMQ